MEKLHWQRKPVRLCRYCGRPTAMGWEACLVHYDDDRRYEAAPFTTNPVANPRDVLDPRVQAVNTFFLDLLKLWDRDGRLRPAAKAVLALRYAQAEGTEVAPEVFTSDWLQRLLFWHPAIGGFRVVSGGMAEDADEQLHPLPSGTWQILHPATETDARLGAWRRILFDHAIMPVFPQLDTPVYRCDTLKRVRRLLELERMHDNCPWERKISSRLHLPEGARDILKGRSPRSGGIPVWDYSPRFQFCNSYQMLQASPETWSAALWSTVEGLCLAQIQRASGGEEQQLLPLQVAEGADGNRTIRI